ncbi:MAG: translation initiation factor IF-2 [Rickettsiales bacterium]|jgi:translation initiation factor IF-2|nr:translation initiation factor IF-2 [Rickettsiales bacterium]
MQKQREKRSTITLGFKRVDREEANSTRISSSGMSLLEERQKFLREAQAKNSEQNVHRRGRTASDPKSQGEEEESALADGQASAAEEGPEERVELEETAKPESVGEREDPGSVEEERKLEKLEGAERMETPREDSEKAPIREKNALAARSEVVTSGQPPARAAGRSSAGKSEAKSEVRTFRRRGSGPREPKNIYDATKSFGDRGRSGEGGQERKAFVSVERTGARVSSPDGGKVAFKAPEGGDEVTKLNLAASARGGEILSNRRNTRGDSKSKTGRGDFEEASAEKLDRKISKDKDKDRQGKYSKNVHTYVFSEDEEDSSKSSPGKYNRPRRREKRGDHHLGGGSHLQQKIFRSVNIPEFLSVSDLAERMNEKKSNIIKKLLTMGVKATANQIIDTDTAELIVMEFGHTPNRVSDSDIENVLRKGSGTELVPRSPVVTVMGHVDHGKTSLLDALRTTNIAESESGGITQHIGASRVDLANDRFITFIDTPGHEAFTEMRMRGANVTDIVVLVVAADDGVKDQTVEAINHTKAAKVPIVVAVNKIDRVGADPDRVRQDLLQHGIVATEFGGNVIFVNVSARNRINLDKLMEAILFQAEILDLEAPIDCEASGAVIESKMDVRRGAVTTVLVQRGVLTVGDIVLAGTSYGKIRKMMDERKKVHESAYPSMAVEILGLDSTPSAGVVFDVVSSEKEARDIISYRERREREGKEAKRSGKTMENILRQAKDGGNRKQLSLILKTDVSGSTEAIAGTLMKLETKEVTIEIVHSAVGSIGESDVNLALTSGSIIVAFNVRASGPVRDAAREKGVEIKYYSVIYDIVNDIRSMMSGLLDPLEKERIIGQAEIREVIGISGVGKIAGCFVTEGEIRRNSNIRLIRDGVVIFDGKIKTLRRFKEDVREVKNNYECGLAIENYDNLAERDIIECYEKIMEKR